MAQFNLAYGCFRKEICGLRQFLALLGSHVIKRGLCAFNELGGILQHIAGISNRQAGQNLHHASAKFGTLATFGK